MPVTGQTNSRSTTGGGGGGGGGGSATIQTFNDTLDSDGQKVIGGLTDADTGVVDAIITSNLTDIDERGTLRLVARTSTTITLQSDAGSAHDGATFEGSLKHS